jgi:trypsin-like peptidase
MGGGAVAAGSFSQEQLEDLATLLGEQLTIGSMQRLAEEALHRDISRDAAAVANDRMKHARKVLDILDHAHAVDKAIALLRAQAQGAKLLVGLNRVLHGERLAGNINLQSFSATYGALLGTAKFGDLLARVGRTVCAVGLEGNGFDMLAGTGFLIGPDLVITNYHVLAPFLTVTNGKVTEKGPGDKIHFFFDYEGPPQPLVPPADGALPNQTARAIKDNWLVCGKPSLINDGTDAAASFVDQLDFVVVQLNRKIGSLPVRAGGGEPRGWLVLPEGPLDVVSQRRIVILQHPLQRPRMFDIGPFHTHDPSKSRVWYWVNTAHGASGGAAVDTDDGSLYAIHNAEVTRAEEQKRPDQQLNQGIRIDMVRDSIVATNPALLATPLPSDAPSFWSLTDDIDAPEPVIGRVAFRGAVADVLSDTGPRVLVVTGPEGSGVRFSTALLKRNVGAQKPVVEFSSIELSQHEPKAFLRALIASLGFLGVPSIPEPRGTEDIPRWLRTELSDWLQSAMGKEGQRASERFPAWVVINAVVPPGQKLIWADNLRECIAALIGLRDAGQAPFDIPQLRWLFLARTPDVLPLGNIDRKDEDLAKESDLTLAYARCLIQAWRTLDRQAHNDSGMLEAVGQTELDKQPNAPQRQVLAAHIKSLLLAGRKRSGGP